MIAVAVAHVEPDVAHAFRRCERALLALLKDHRGEFEGRLRLRDARIETSIDRFPSREPSAPIVNHPAQGRACRLGTTSNLPGMDPEEIVTAVRTRRPPMVSAGAGCGCDLREAATVVLHARPRRTRGSSPASVRRR
jgi:hypothetical protein